MFKYIRASQSTHARTFVETTRCDAMNIHDDARSTLVREVRETRCLLCCACGCLRSRQCCGLRCDARTRPNPMSPEPSYRATLIRISGCAYGVRLAHHHHRVPRGAHARTDTQPASPPAQMNARTITSTHAERTGTHVYVSVRAQQPRVCVWVFFSCQYGVGTGTQNTDCDNNSIVVEVVVSSS